MDPLWLAENESERRRLFEMTGKLTAADLARPLPNGWTIATKLAHLAFWDQYCLAAILDWERNGFATYHINVDTLNDAVRTLSNAIPSSSVIQLAQEAADAIDRKIPTLSPDLVTAIESAGYTRMLRRSQHRRHHLDQIQQALTARPWPQVP
jgi:hypothetical protein